MKGKIQKILKTVILMLMVLSLISCGSADSLYQKTENGVSAPGEAAGGGADGDFSYFGDSWGSDWNSEVEEESTNTDAAVDESGNSSMREMDRKLIKTVNMTVETKTFDEMYGRLKQQVDALGGYIENMEIYNGSVYDSYRSSRSASLKIRVPREKLEDFLFTVTDLGNVVRRNDSEDDVTLTYVDLESHKLALETEQERLLELLERAETVEDIITIESRLSDIRYQIESMESQLRTYDNKVNYSTVYMDIEEVQELTPIAKATVWERISGGFMDSLKNLGNGLTDLVVWLLSNLPYLIVLGLLAGLIVWICIRQSRKAKKKRLANPGNVYGYGNMSMSGMRGYPGQNPMGNPAQAPIGNAPTGNSPTGNVPTGNTPTGNASTGDASMGNPTGEAASGFGKDSAAGQSQTGQDKA